LKSKAALTLVALAGGLLLGEGVLRAHLFLGGWQRLADPSAYADPLCDDTYWLLLNRAKGWKGRPETAGPYEWDPELGWTPDRRNLDAQGAWPNAKNPQTLLEPPIALFGDSFLFGTTPNGERISDFLQEALPHRRVLNFAVGGYGVDQMVLAAERHLSKLDSATVVLGIMTTDLDRAVLSVRTAPKPRAVLEESLLRFQLPGAEEGAAAWFASHPPGIASYLLAFLSRQAALKAASAKGHLEPECRVEEKTAIHQALMSRFHGICQAGAHRCQVLLFHRQEALDRPEGWRSLLVKQSAKALELPVLDTREIFQATAKAAGQDARQLYGTDRHPTAAANAAVAAALTETLGSD